MNNRKLKRRPILPGKICRNDDIGSVECKLSMERLVRFDRLNTDEGGKGWKAKEREKIDSRAVTEIPQRRVQVRELLMISHRIDLKDSK